MFPDPMSTEHAALVNGTFFNMAEAKVKDGDKCSTVI